MKEIKKSKEIKLILCKINLVVYVLKFMYFNYIKYTDV